MNADAKEIDTAVAASADAADDAADPQVMAAALAARTAWDVRIDRMTKRGANLVDRVCAYDYLASLILNRDTTERRAFVERLRQLLLRRYALEFNNVDDTFARDICQEFFTAAATSSSAEQLQTFVIHWAILVEDDVRRWFCPDPPDPDAVDAEAAVDRARVDRVAFNEYLRLLFDMYDNLRARSRLSLGAFVRELNAYYVAMLPPDPVAAVVHAIRQNPRAARRVEFRDAEARQLVEDAWRSQQQ